MKCPNCAKEWPDGVKFCGNCGTKLEEASVPGLDPAKAKVNEQLRSLFPRIGLGEFHELQPGHHICQHGSTHVDVRVIDFGEKIAVRSVAPVSIGSRLDADLLKFLLEKNAGFIFGAFGLDPQGMVVFSHTILASSLDAEELGASVNTVLVMADRYDDEIVQRWGGKTMKQTVIDKVLPSHLLELLRKAQART